MPMTRKKKRGESNAREAVRYYHGNKQNVANVDDK
jgi:hypothetical protein